jgi:hypothetical protein
MDINTYSAHRSSDLIIAITTSAMRDTFYIDYATIREEAQVVILCIVKVILELATFYMQRKLAKRNAPLQKAAIEISLLVVQVFNVLIVSMLVSVVWSWLSTYDSSSLGIVLLVLAVITVMVFLSALVDIAFGRGHSDTKGAPPAKRAHA